MRLNLSKQDYAPQYTESLKNLAIYLFTYFSYWNIQNKKIINRNSVNIS